MKAKRNDKIILLFTFLFVILTMLSGCKKDKDEVYDGSPTGTGSVMYQGSTYQVKYAGYELYGQFQGVYNYELYIFSDGINVDAETGKGNILSIYFSTYEAPIPTGTIPYYTYNVPEVPTFDATLYLNYDLVEETGIRVDDFEDGTVKISKSGDMYSLELNCYTVDQDTVVVKYTGKIPEF